jgi:hypothetical protein
VRVLEVSMKIETIFKGLFESSGNEFKNHVSHIANGDLFLDFE